MKIMASITHFGSETEIDLYDFRVKYLKEKDDVIKGEIVDQMVDDGFYPCLAIDDRPRVLRGYRSKGIKTLTVGDPYIEF